MTALSTHLRTFCWPGTSSVRLETEAIYEFAINTPLAVDMRSCFPSGIPTGDPDSLADSNTGRRLCKDVFTSDNPL